MTRREPVSFGTVFALHPYHKTGGKQKVTMETVMRRTDREQKELEFTIQYMAYSHDEGLRLCDFVEKLLEAGYTNQGSKTLSVETYEILNRLVNEGIIDRADEQYVVPQNELCGCG